MQGYRKRIEVDVHDIDFNGVCRASSLLKYIQSAADAQLTENGMSYSELANKRRAFIISKIKIELSESVREYEILEAETFPCVSRGFSFLRCYALYKDSRVIGKAISVWALVDTDTRRLVKVSDFNLDLPTFEPNEVELAYFRFPDTAHAVGEYTVTYADLDRNMHVNNTKYADIFSNFLPLSKKRIEAMTVSYVNEAKYLDRLKVFYAEENGRYYLRTLLPDGRVNAEAEISLTDI